MLRRADRLRARQATLHARIALIPGEHVAHPDGFHRTVPQTSECAQLRRVVITVSRSTAAA